MVITSLQPTAAGDASNQRQLLVALFGSVGAAITVFMVVIVAIMLVAVVVLTRRKKSHSVTMKGTEERNHVAIT